jgi:RNA polymerase sigma-70 factor, ECF subfamily
MPQEPSPTSDRVLVDRIAAGDVTAFEELYRLHAPALLGFASSRLPSREAAEDTVQEFFLALWRHRQEWRLDRSVRAYLFGALRNHMVSAHRRHQAREGRLQRVDDPAETNSIPGSAWADHRVRESELADAIEMAIKDLSPRCRETFLLVRQQHLSYAEVAEVMGISVKGVEMNMVRALASLREQLAEWRT